MLTEYIKSVVCGVAVSVLYIGCVATKC